MRKREFMKHLEVALGETSKAIDELPETAHVRGITVTDRSGFVNEPAPEGRLRTHKTCVHVRVAVKLNIGITTSEVDNGRGNPFGVSANRFE